MGYNELDYMRKYAKTNKSDAQKTLEAMGAKFDKDGKIIKAIEGNTLDSNKSKDDNKKSVDDNKTKDKGTTNSNAESTTDSHPVFKRYNIDPTTFSVSDLQKWAEEHNHTVDISFNSGTVDIKPKTDGGFLGIGAKSKATQQEEEDAKVLLALAYNTGNANIAQEDLGAAVSAGSGFMDGYTFGFFDKAADFGTKRQYEKAGLPEDLYVKPSQALDKTKENHPVANTVGTLTGVGVTLASPVGKGAITKGVSTAADWAKTYNNILKASKALGATKGAIRTAKLARALPTIMTMATPAILTYNRQQSKLSDADYEQLFKVQSEYSNNPMGKGNIDLTQRPIYQNEDGTISTVSSMTITEDGKAILIPTIVYGPDGVPTRLTEDEAIEYYHKTGEHLGMFDSIKDADEYAKKLSKEQGIYYSNMLDDKKDLPLEWLEKQIATGNAQYAKGLAASLDFILPTEVMGKYDLISKVNDYYGDTLYSNSLEAQQSSSNLGKGWETAGEAVQVVTAALPNSITALFLAGATVPAQATQFSKNATINATANFLKQTANNPQYWTSLLQTIGTDYEDAKKNGASETVASVSAIISSAINAGIELGGIQGLPDKLVKQLSGDVSKRTVRNLIVQWATSMLEEGYEEVLQGIVTNLTAKMLYNHNAPILSTTDENAVINPVKALKEFSLGAVAGGFLGGGQIAAIETINRGNISRVGNYMQQFKDEVIAIGLSSPQDTESYKLAQKLSKKSGKVSDYNLGKLHLANLDQLEVKVGDTFIENGTGREIKIVNRDENATELEITLNGKTETVLRTNETADTLAVDDKYNKVETPAETPTENVAVAENAITTEAGTPQTSTPINITLTKVGNSYEAYGEAAHIIAEELDITPTKKVVDGVEVDAISFPTEFYDGLADELSGSYNFNVVGVPATTPTEVKNESATAESVSSNKKATDNGVGTTSEEISLVVDAMNETLKAGAEETIYESMPPKFEKSLDTFANSLIRLYKKHGSIGHIADYFSDGGKKVISAIESTLSKSNLDNKTVVETKQNTESVLKNQSESATINEKTTKTVPDADKAHTVAYTNDNERIELKFKVVSVDDLVVSNSLDGKVNPNYPQELQPRDRSRTSSQSQIRQMAANLNPARLEESTSVSEGSPIVGPDNVVESGNGRTLAIELAYKNGTADEYRQYIINNADQYGIDASNLPERPVLVRERLTEVDRIEFTRKANESSIGSLSATEQAKVDAEKLTEDVLNLLVANDDGIINTSDNHNFISAVITKVFKNEDLNNVVGAEGRLSARGLERITNAIFYKAYGDASLSARLSESLDNDMKNATKVLLNIAPRIVSIKNGITSGNIYDFDFSTDIVSAIKLFEKCRNDGQSIKDYVLQTSLFEKEEPLVIAMAYVFETKNRGAKQATDFYNLLLDTVEELGNPNQISLDIIETFQTKGEIFDATVEKFNNGVESKNTIAIPENIYGPESEPRRENDRRGIDEVSGNEPNENEKTENAVGVQPDNRRGEETGVVANDEQLRQKNESVERQSTVENEDVAKDVTTEREDNGNEQIGSDSLSGNGRWGHNGNTRKQTERISYFKRKNQGRNATDRQSFARELIKKGHTEEVTERIGKHTYKYTLVKPEAYNDDMLSMVEDAKRKGVELGFFVGNAKVNFDNKGEFVIDGIKFNDTRVLVQYDATRTPQILAKHEIGHAKWKSPEMQKAKYTILNGLSDADKKEVLLQKRYNRYMEIYKNEDIVWEEFVVDVMSGMNEYTANYIDVVTDYWYGSEAFDSYSPADYTTSTDAGGKKAETNEGYNGSVRFSAKTKYNEYNSFGMKWAYSSSTKIGDRNVLYKPRIKKYVLVEATKEDVGFIELKTGTYKQLREDEKIYESNKQREYADNERDIDTAIHNFESGQNHNTRSNVDVGNRGTGIQNAEVSERKSESNKTADTQTDNGNLNEGKRFSFKNDIEETKDLVAVHNLNAEQLLDVLSRGQFAMPSIAVTNKSHSAFGDISVVFNKDTIDPAQNAENKLYGSDAWTPTQTRLKKNPVFDDNAVANKVKAIKQTIGGGYSQIFDMSNVAFKHAISKADGSVYDAFSGNIGLQSAYALENNLIPKVPKTKGGKIDTALLKEQLNAKLDNDSEWRNYKKWLGEISDNVITSYDTASNEEVLNNMKQQPATAKTFRLGVNGELVVPAVEYGSIDDYRANKNRLSEDAESMTNAVGQELVGWAKEVQTETRKPLSKVVNAINSAFANRYNANDIVGEFANNGIEITKAEAQTLQHLYKKAVELPTPYFEAKPQRAVGLNEVAMVVIPDTTSQEVRSALDAKGTPYLEYEANNKQARVEALNSVEGVRFSLKDSDGNTLSEEQQEYFKDSKVRDENGNLVVMYQGSANDFTVFDRKKSSYANLYGRGFYFTKSESHASRYGKTRAYYLNIKHPVSTTETTITKSQLRKFLQAVNENEDYSFENYGYGATVDSVLQSTYGKSDFLMLNDVSQTAIGDLVETVELFNEVNGTEYDGIMLDTETVTFNSEQAKLTSNEKPTSNPDIRYSLKDQDYLKAVENGDVETASKMVEKAAKDAGYAIKAYHGTPNNDFTVFDKNRVGKGTDQYGAGFYFASNKDAARAYGARIIDSRLLLEKPLKINGSSKDGANLIDAGFDYLLTEEQAYEVIKRLPNIYDSEESPLGDYFDSYWESGAEDWMIEDLAANDFNRNIGYLDSDLFRNYPNELHEALRDVVGYDGVEVTFANGDKFYVAWFDHQMKSGEPVTYDDNGNIIPLSERFNESQKDIRYSVDDYAPTFYSHMGKTIDDMKQDKIGVNSVISYLKGRGVKDEEIKWSGIETFLDGKKSVTKAELQEFVANNQLQIEEITLNNNEIPYTQEQTAQINKYESERNEIFEELKREWKKALGTDFPMQSFGLGLESSVVNLLMETNRQIKESVDVGKDMVDAREQLKTIFEKDDFGYDSQKEAYMYAVRNPYDFMYGYELTDEQKAIFERFISAKENYKNAEGIPVETQTHLKDIAAKSDAISRKISRIKSEHYAENAKHMTKWGEYTLDGGYNYREIIFTMPDSTYTNDAMNTHWSGSIANGKAVLAHARIQDFNVDGEKMLFIEEIQSDWHNEGMSKGYKKKLSPAEEKTIAEITDKRAELFNELQDLLQEIRAIDIQNPTNRAEATNALWVKANKLRSEERALKEEAENIEGTEKSVPDAPFRNYHEYVLKSLIRMAAEQGYDSIGWTTADIQSQRWSEQYAEGYRIEYDQDIPKFLNKYGKKWGAKVGRTWLTLNEDLDKANVWSMDITDSMKESVLYEGQARYSLATDGILDLEDLWADAIEEYGTIPKGEIPARDVDVPKKINKKDVVSRFARTMIEAGVTPDETVSAFEKAILDGTMTHEVITNKNASERAKQLIKHLGFEGALEQWSVLSESGKVGKNELALGMELYNQCITNKDVHNAMKLAAELVAEATRAGQTLQATRMLKRMTPDGQLYYLEKSIQKMNEEFKEKLGDKYKDVELDEELMEEFLTEKDEKKRNEIYDKVCQNIADQIPATQLDKWNSWRYLAMLGNLRTHLRNIFGNAVFIPSLKLKNYIGAVAEKAAKVNTSNRTKSLRKSKETVEFAKKDVEEMIKVLQGENAKYAVTSDIQGKRTIFKTRWLEKLRLKNFDFLEREDMWFLKYHYTDALARLITARNIDVNSITPQMLEQLRAYAVKEAQAATYRDANALAEGLNRLQKNLEHSPKRSIRASGILLEGVMPFKKTPMNIAKQGLNYSPLGILKGVYKSFTQLKKGDTTITEVIDDLSKGLSGTMVMLLGYFLASMGWLGGDEDKTQKEKEFDKMVGEQSYALNVGDIFSYTIDWMTPSNLSLFIGAKLHDLTKDDFEFADVVGALSTVTEPLLELSVFSGLNGVIESAQYSDSEALLAIGSDMITSYLMQGLPTIGGQISRIVDQSKREYYYTDKNSVLPQGLQRLIGQASSKIPFASYLFQPSIDEWGREETYGNSVERVLENTVSPGYYSANNYTEVDKELKELHERTGDDSVLPVIQQKKYTEDAVNYYMSAEDYTETKKIRGQKSFELVSELLSDKKSVKLQNKKTNRYQNKRYSQMSDDEKVRAIKKCYEEAGDYTKEQMLEKVKSKSK